MNSVFLAVGPDSFLLQEFIEQYKQAAIQKYGEFSVQKLSITDYSIHEIINEVMSPAFFGGKRIVFLENFPPPASPKLSEKKKEEYELLLQKMADLPEEVVLFCVSATPDKRTKFFKTLKKNAQKIYEHPSFDPKKDRKKIIEWIQEKVQKFSSQISEKDAEFLQAFVGNELTQLHSEIKKLCLYKAGQTIEKKDIIDICVPSEETADFAFSNAVSKGRSEKIIEEFTHLVDQFDAAMVWNRDVLSSMRTLLKVRFSIDSPGEKSGIHPFVLRNMKATASKFSSEQLITLQSFLTDIDTGSKNGTYSLSGDTRNFSLAVQRVLWESFS